MNVSAIRTRLSELLDFGHFALLTATVPADVIKTVEVVCDLGDCRRDDCAIQRNEKDRKAQCEPASQSMVIASFTRSFGANVALATDASKKSLRLPGYETSSSLLP